MPTVRLFHTTAAVTFGHAPCHSYFTVQLPSKYSTVGIAISNLNSVKNQPRNQADVCIKHTRNIDIHQ